MKRLVRVSFTFAVLAMLAVATSGCGDGESNNDVTEDALDVVQPDTVDAIDDVQNDADREVDQPDSSADTLDIVCTCSVADACCDGCLPINEGGACDVADADAGPCQVETCQAGACVIADKVCTPDGTCATENGTCDMETGECSFINVMAGDNGLECEAQPGIDGSGLCLFGECLPFADCDFRAYDQAAGMPCNFNSECASGICRAYGWGWDHYCSAKCDNGAACPDGLRCVKDDVGEYFCERIGESFPGDASVPLFKPCNTDADCAGGMCLGYDQTRFCSADCEATGGGAADAAVCGDCGDCVSGGLEKGFQFEYYCVPDSDGQPGEVCQSPMDCSRHFCYEGYCSDQCFIISEELDTCPEGFKCIPDAYQPDLQSCVAITSLNKERGDVCAHDYECVSGFCRAIGDVSICVDTCDECEGGSCVQLGWIDTDTFMELWKDADAAAKTSDNDGGEGSLSRISYYISESGTYYLHVRGDDDTVNGPYILSATLEGMDPADIENEVEPNDDQAGATDRILPFLINAQLEAAGHDWFSFEVVLPMDVTSIRLIAETTPLPDNMCVPAGMDGTAAYGDACAWDWQCVEGLNCLSGMCNKTCLTDTDCPDGICFTYSETDLRCVPADMIGQKEVQESCQYTWECADQCYGDNYLGEAYCTRNCTQDEDCPWGMGCLGDLCNKGFPEPNFPYGYCRMNADCESYNCVDGMCAQDCTADTDCEGFDAIVPTGPKELCASCNVNTDCNDGTETMFDESYCVQVSETEKFCAPQCTYSEGSCPDGTRCYSLDYFTKVCAPISFTCAGGQVGCIEENSSCVRPFIFEGEICRFDDECFEGKCAQGICRAETCDGTIECGCDLLECVDHYCVYTPAAGRVLEVEPNNDVDTAQELLSTPIKVVGGFNVDGQTSVDNDIYKLQLVAGTAYSFVMSAACETASDPAMLLRSADGAYIDGYAIDDSETSYFPAILGYLAEASETIYIEVVQGPWVEGFLRQPYVLDITSFVPESGDSCVGATELGSANDLMNMERVRFDLATDSGIAPTAMGTLSGPDVFRYVDLPAKVPGSMFSEWTLVVESQPDPSDIALWAFTDCADMDASLVSWSNFNVVIDSRGPTEGITLLNETDSVKRVYIGYNSASFDSVQVNPFSLLRWGDHMMAEAGDTPENAQLHGSTVGTMLSTQHNLIFPWGADLAPTLGACASMDTSAKDVVIKVNVPAGTFLKAQMTQAYMKGQMYLLDARDMTTCQAAGNGALYYMPPLNEADPALPNTVYVVVEPVGHPGGQFNLETTIMEVGECAGPCDPTTAASTCTDATNFCTCNATSKFWEKTDCAATCIAGGYSVSGECHTFVTGTAAGKSQCMCEFDCEMPGLTETLCGNGQYSNCTCDTSDPCAWLNDGTCDIFCTNEFENGFDDSTDCTPPAP